MKTTRTKQYGITFSGFIMMMVVLVVVAVFAMKLVPAYMENGKIQHALESIVRDDAMQNATVAEIKDSFYKRAIAMDNVTDININDLEIYKEDGRLVLSVKYLKKLPLAGNVSLLVDFSAKAPK